MSKPSTPQYPQITPSQVTTGQDATSQAMALAQQYFPQQMGAQAQGINDINQGAAYYNSYQPSSFADALANQSFQNIWPNEQANIMNSLSQSGMAYSPVAATTLGNAYGNLSTGIGEYLNQQGNTEATNNLNSLLNINPNNYYGPISSSITGQSNEQAGLNQQANIQNAGAQYSNQLANYNQGLATNGAIGTGVGAVAGGLVGGLPGASLGAGLGGALMGGSGGATGLGNNLSSYLLASQYFSNPSQNQSIGSTGPMSGSTIQNAYGSGNASSVYGQPGTTSQLPANPFGGQSSNGWNIS